MPKTVILSAARTPVGKLGGGLSTLDAIELGATAIKAALERAEVAPDDVQHVVMGQVLQAGQGQIPSRQAQIKAGIPKEVSSETINKVCASGIRAACLLDNAIRAGDLEVGVGGGMESMSKAPYLLKEARFGFRMGDAKALDAMVHDGLTNPFSGKQMFVEATEVGDELEMTRADMDRWALRSHELAIKATDEGRLPEEIVPVTISSKKGDTTVEVDEGPRRDTSLEKLAASARPGRQGRLAHSGQLTGRQRRGRRAGSGQRRMGQEQRAPGAGDDRHPRPGRRRLPLPGPHAGQRRQEGARAGRVEDRGHRPVGDQRGVRLGGAQLDPDARDRRGSRQRQRRRGCPRPPDRCLGRPDPRVAGARAAPARRGTGLRGDLLGRRPGRCGDRGGERGLSSPMSRARAIRRSRMPSARLAQAPPTRRAVRPPPSSISTAR